MFKKIFLTLVIIASAALTGAAQMQRGEKAFGPKLGYISHNTSAVAGLTFQYAFSDHLRISPEIGCAFRHNDEDALLIDLNLHMPFGVGGERVALYPLAGLTFNSWAKHSKEMDLDNSNLKKDVTTHVNRFGVNLGAGFDLRCSQTLKVNIEAKYSLLKSYSGVLLTAGISYVF